MIGSPPCGIPLVSLALENSPTLPVGFTPCVAFGNFPFLSVKSRSHGCQVFPTLRKKTRVPHAANFFILFFIFREKHLVAEGQSQKGVAIRTPTAATVVPPPPPQSGVLESTARRSLRIMSTANVYTCGSAILSRLGLHAGCFSGLTRWRFMETQHQSLTRTTLPLFGTQNAQPSLIGVTT